MKKIFAMTAIAAAIAMPASAQMYVGAGLGSSRFSDNSDTFADPGGPITYQYDKTKTSWKLLGGFQFTPMWGIEVQYTDLGKRDFFAQQGLVGLQANISADQYSAAGTGKYYFAPRYFFHAKLGVTENTLNFGKLCGVLNPATCVSAGKYSDTDVLWGIGFGHDFTKNWSIKGGYENLGYKSASNMGVNVVYSF